MIPYDDLVAALSAWRAKKGMPVSTMGATSASGPVPVAAPVAKPPSGPTPAPMAKSPSGPKTQPPSPAPGARAKGSTVPPPLAPPDALEEVDEVLDESAYENEGNDFAMGFSGGNDDSATAIGAPPQRDSATTDVGFAPKRGGSGGTKKRNDEW
jgi:hypothetical protein